MKMQENKSEIELIKDTIILWIKNWYYFVISMAICVVLAVIYYETKTPLMRVTAQVNLRQDESLAGASSVTRSQSLLSAFGLGKSAQNIEDETIKINSQGYVKKIIKKYALNFDYTQTKFCGLVKTNLYDQSPIEISVSEAVSDTISPVVFILDIKKDQTKVKMKWGRKVVGKYELGSFPSVLETPFGAFTFSKSKYYENYKKPLKIQVFCANYDFMAQVYRELIEADFEKKTSDLMQLNINTENTVFGKKVLNELITIYNTEWDSNKKEVTDKTLFFINGRLEQVYDQMIRADQAIQSFKNKNYLTDVEADVKYNLLLSGELQPVLLEAETQLKLIDIIVDFVNDENNKYSQIPLTPNTTPAIADVIGKYNDALAIRNEMHKSTSQSVLVKEYNELVETQRTTFLKSVEITKKSLQIAANNAKKKESEVKYTLGKIPGIEKDYIQLRREQELQQTIYIFLLEMKEQTGVKGISLLPKLQVIDEPYVINKPVEPKLIKVAITALFFGGFLLPFSAIYGIPLVRNYIRRRKEK